MKRGPARKRPYTMGARAEAVRVTTARILEVAARAFTERPYDDVSLAAIAEAAGVTVQTLLRRWGSKEGLVDAASQAGAEVVRAARAEAPVGDVAGAVANLIEHYEAWGDRMVRLLGQEERVAALRRVTDRGRRVHQEWVERVFAPQLARVGGAARERLYAKLVAATDVGVWKVLRRDLGLGRDAAELALREMVHALVA